VQAQLALKNANLNAVRAEGQARGEEGRQAYFAAVNEAADWRRRTQGFQRLIQRRLALVKSRMPRGPAQPPSPYGSGLSMRARLHYRDALAELTRAVAEHQRKVLNGDGTEDDDEVLWRHLSEVTAIDGNGNELPLTEWLQYLRDQETSHLPEGWICPLWLDTRPARVAVLVGVPPGPVTWMTY
jgi:hypothetical protein